MPDEKMSEDTRDAGRLQRLFIDCSAANDAGRHTLSEIPRESHPKAEPKQLDIKTDAWTMRAIYRFDGDKLIVAGGSPSWDDRMMRMSMELQARTKAFLERPIPAEIRYVPDSLSERFLATYAASGAVDLDPEFAEIFDLCVLEAFHASDSKAGAEAEHFRECALLLQAIQAETQE